MLDRNEIGDEGAVAIAEAITQESPLTTLSLNHNDITLVGGQALYEAARKSKQLSRISLGKESGNKKGIL